MSGHSHWATIRRKKGAQDAKRGAVFTRLALAIEKARAGNMPKENIERAIHRGTGEDKEGGSLEEITYEGYGPHGVAIMIDCVTDNRNRAVAEVRHALTHAGGTMAEAGAVGWQFHRASYFYVPSNELSYDKAFELAVEAGADDVFEDGDMIEILGPVEAFKSISDRLQSANAQPEEAGLRLIAKQEMELRTEQTLQVMRVIETLEDLDDVQNVYHNLKLSAEAMAALEAE